MLASSRCLPRRSSSLQKWYGCSQVGSSPLTQNVHPGAFPFISLDSPEAIRTLQDVFESGLSRGPNEDCFGHRPIVSTSPLKFSDQFVWQSWATIDARRRAVGSGLLKLFEDGVIGGGDLRTVGIWSKNCPSELSYHGDLIQYSETVLVVQIGRSLIWLLRRTRSWGSVCTTHLATMQLVCERLSSS